MTFPPRLYELTAAVFARAAEQDPSGAIRRAVAEAASQTGRELATVTAAGSSLVDHLRQHGYEPYDDAGVIRLQNCPFHQLARNTPTWSAA